MIVKEALATSIPLEVIYKPAASLGGGNAKISTLLNPIIANVLIVSGIAAFFVIIFAGFSYVTAGGDKGKVTQSQNMLNYGIIGLILVVSAYVITRLIGAAMGISTGSWI